MQQVAMAALHGTTSDLRPPTFDAYLMPSPSKTLLSGALPPQPCNLSPRSEAKVPGVAFGSGRA